MSLIHVDLLFQSRVAPGLQGRSAATRAFLHQGSFLAAAVLLGPAVDQVFGPALAGPGTWAEPLAVVWGLGPGSGIALLWSLLGVAVLGALALTSPGARAPADCASAAKCNHP